MKKLSQKILLLIPHLYKIIQDYFIPKKQKSVHFKNKNIQKNKCNCFNILNKTMKCLSNKTIFTIKIDSVLQILMRKSDSNQ